MYFSADFPSTDFHESCGRLEIDSTYANDTTPGYNGDCNGESFTVMCLLIDVFSVIIIQSFFVKSNQKIMIIIITHILI